MNNFEFRGFVATPGEKHIGIAEIKAWGKIVLRYKIVQKKDGKGFFPVAASNKIVENGMERYVNAFTIDSNSDKEDIEGMVMHNVQRILQSQSTGFAGPQINQQPMGGTFIPTTPHQAFPSNPITSTFAPPAANENLPF